MADFGYGQQTPWDTDDEVNRIAFAIRQLTARMNTMKLVQVKAVQSGGTFAAPGTVNVLPLVNQVDGNNNATPHGVVNGIPFARVIGGRNAVICDPQVGDIGYVVCADRDISNVKASGKQSNPGSWRRFDLADGVYVGGLMGSAPDQYVAFLANGIKIVDKNGNIVLMDPSGITLTDLSGNVIAMRSGLTTITGNVKVTGTLESAGLQTDDAGLNVTGTITATVDVVAAGHHLATHLHSGVTAGVANSGGPVG